MKQKGSTVLVAAVLGFAAGVLLAPKSGPETRERLRIQAEEAKARVRKATDELKRQKTESTEQLVDAAEAVKQKGRTMKDTLTERADESKYELKTKL